ncbi:MAG TPA: hypothetical protein VF183_07285 [Acidimicrobiales bacterium]
MPKPRRGAPTELRADPERFPHGTRNRYLAGCRCDACRRANSAYQNEVDRQPRAAALELARTRPMPPVWVEKPKYNPHTGRFELRRMRGCVGIDDRPCPHNAQLRVESVGDLCGKCRLRLVSGTTDGAPVRAHLEKLSAAGVGYRTIADVAGIAPSVVARIRNGLQVRVRVVVARKILAVDETAREGGSLVPATETRRHIRWLTTKGGLTKTEIGERLGVSRLQRDRRFVTFRSAFQIAQLRAAVEAELEAERQAARVCVDCGHAHGTVEDRVAILRRHIGLDAAEIIEAWPCVWGDGSAGQGRIHRDLRVLRQRLAVPAQEGTSHDQEARQG